MAECPLDEMNRPRASAGPQLRVPPAEAEIEALFSGWRAELATCRKFLLGALAHACGAGRLAHEPCGRQKRCMLHSVLDRHSDSLNI